MPTMAMRNALVVINHKAMLSEMTLKIWQGNGAFIVVWEPWKDRESRKIGYGKTVHMAKESSLSELKLEID